MKRHQIDRRNRAGDRSAAGWQRFTDDTFLGHELIQARADQLVVDLQDLCGLADQVRIGEVAMPVIGGL